MVAVQAVHCTFPQVTKFKWHKSSWFLLKDNFFIIESLKPATPPTKKQIFMLRCDGCFHKNFRDLLSALIWTSPPSQLLNILPCCWATTAADKVTSSWPFSSTIQLAVPITIGKKSLFNEWPMSVETILCLTPINYDSLAIACTHSLWHSFMLTGMHITMHTQEQTHTHT